MTGLPHSREALSQRLAAGESFTYYPFYGHRPDPDGFVTDACLSQWFVWPFDVDGITYPTAEHWMMAGKARLFKDDAMLAAILATPSPRDAKAYGRQGIGPK